MQPSSEKIVVFWYRRDLRLGDNAGLYHALKSGFPVLPLFIFDAEILDRLNDPADARVTFIHDIVTELHGELGGLGSTLLLRHGSPVAVFQALMDQYPIAAVYTNRDYEPMAIARDNAVAALLATRGIPLHGFKDQVIFEGQEVLKDDGKPYTVFTPYSRKWKAKLEGDLSVSTEGAGRSFYFQSYPTAKYHHHFLKTSPTQVPTLQSLGFQRSAIPIPPPIIPQGLIRSYDTTRDYPAQAGTSRLGIHFRFGTISIREKASKAAATNATYLNELIWRDFYSMILQHFPQVVDGPFKPQYAAIQWRNDESEFQAWCKGLTGYPIVDAGMRELNATGFMHNRVRMITASFLAKHLLIDWRWGEAYFAEKLLDYDLASNNGGWQWAAGCGTDAAPYFRIFSPDAQQQRFDPKLEYIRRWVPELGTSAYPQPIVDHKEARERCLTVYKAGLEPR